MAKTRLFAPLALQGARLQNRIVIAPMRQLFGRGRLHDRLASRPLRPARAVGRGPAHPGLLTQACSPKPAHPSLLTIEATAVAPEGRITFGDVGLYSDANETAFARVLGMIRQYSDMPVAVQLAHAGRKASCDLPWLGGRSLRRNRPKAGARSRPPRCPSPNPTPRRSR